jgi:hypothetical protein
VKVLAILIVVLGLVVVIVPQFTNCEYGAERPATLNMQTSHSHAAEYASMGGMDVAAGESTSVPYRMMKCFWSARAEIAIGAPLAFLGALLLFSRRKEVFRIIGVMTVFLGVLAIIITTSLIGTCANPAMVCNTQMKPTLLVAGGITAALGAAVVVLGETRRPTDGPTGAVAA